MKKHITLAMTGLAAFVVQAVDLVVPAGDTVTVTENATYETVTVNGTLTIAGGTFSATTLNIADGDGATGEVIVDGGTVSMGGSRSINVGINGGSGKLTVKRNAAGQKDAHVMNALTLGATSGSSGILRLDGGVIQGTGVLTGVDSGASRVEFNGGTLKYTGYFFVSKGELLTISSVDGNTMDVVSVNANKLPFDLRGAVVTEGTGSLRLTCSSGIVPLDKKTNTGTITYGHTGGFVLKGSEFRLDRGDFFGGLDVSVVPASATAAAPILDLNGKIASVGSLQVEGVVTNKAEGALSILVGLSDSSATSVFEVDDMDARIALVKQGEGTLDFRQAEFFAPITVSGGVFAVSSRVAVSNVTQATGGLVKIGAEGVLEFHGDTWTAPAFASDSTGPVEVKAAETALFDSPALAFRGDLSVKEGTLTIASRGGPTLDRYFRFTMKASYYHASYMALSRLRLLDAAGNVLSDGLTEAAAGTAASALAPGTCALAENYAQHYKSNVTNLFDGIATTWIFFNSGSFSPSTVADNTWRTVVFRLPSEVTAPVAQYQLTSPDPDAKQRNVSAWSLESSADGLAWTLLDDRVSLQTRVEDTDFVDGPFGFTNSVVGLSASVTFPASATVEVASGATLALKTSSQSIPVVKVDLSAYAGGSGTIDGFVPVNGGTLKLLNATGTPPYVLPLNLPGVSNGTFPDWSVCLDGSEKSGWRVKKRGDVTTAEPTPGLMLLFK